MTKNRTRILVTTLVLTIGVSGCATTDPFTGEKKTTKTTTGTAFGAIAGALIGAATSSKNDRTKGVLIGAGVGALAGGSVGYYMDKQEEKLRNQLRGTGVSVTRDGDNIILNMPSNITFDFDSYQLKSEFMPTLDSVVLVLNEFKSTLITAEGHTDSKGSEAYNQKLSENRALSVSNYLINKGVKQQRLAAVGRGELKPVADNNTIEGRSLNRRVELTLEPIVKE
ncbi:MAG: OmpA family protein [Gammaproteobacteria bacterium]|nr:OmpA family protein [Gammaproteobacteria bacterium]